MPFEANCEVGLVSECSSDRLLKIKNIEMKNSHKRPHYIPRLYWRGFANNKGQVAIMDKKKFFQGASHYWILEEEDRIRLRKLKDNDDLVEKRIEFREKLNELSYRITYAHSKITLIWDVLQSHESEKIKRNNATLSLVEDLLKDILDRNLLEIAEVIDQLCKGLKVHYQGSFGDLFRRVGKNRLKKIFDQNDILIQKYNSNRQYLFDDLLENEVNIPKDVLVKLGKRIEGRSTVLKLFRDKVISHDDKERFKTHLVFEDYLECYQEVIRLLNAISVVATLGEIICRIEEPSPEIKNWLTRGLIESLVKDS